MQREVGLGGSAKPRVAAQSSGRRNTTTGNAIRRSRSLVTKPQQNPERIIALELILAETIYIAVAIYTGEEPRPRVIASLLAVYAILGLVTIFGPQWGRVAYLLGALIVLAAALNRQVASAIGKYQKATGPTASPGARTTATLIQTAALS